MYCIKSEKPIKPQIQISKKSERRFSGVLRRLAQSEGTKNNKIKVIISEGEIIEEEDKIFLAPSSFRKPFERPVVQNQTKNVNNFENPNVDKKILITNDIQIVDYPDSSDFSDDE